MAIMGTIGEWTSAVFDHDHPKRGRKKKVVIDSSEEGVANALTGFLKTKEKDIKEKLNTKKKEKEELEEKIKELVKKARTLENTTGKLAQKYEETISKNRSEVVDDYRKLITKIKLLDFIEKFEVDSEKRILFTTTPISIQKETWKKSKVAGRYQVRIDFRAGNIREGVRAINIDQYHGSYDHPNISGSMFCYGNKLAVDVEQEYREQDLYELVIDIVDLLRSPNDQDGFTRWGHFFKGAKKRPKGYSFIKYDQEFADINNNLVLDPGFSRTYTTEWGTNFAQTYAGTIQSMANNVFPYSAYPDQGVEIVARELLRLGFIDYRSARVFAERILHRTRGIIPDSIEIQRLSTDNVSDAELYYRYRPEHYGYAYYNANSLGAVTVNEPTQPADRIDRIAIPGNLLLPQTEISQQQTGPDLLAQRAEQDRQRAVRDMEYQMSQYAQQMTPGGGNDSNGGGTGGI